MSSACVPESHIDVCIQCCNPSAEAACPCQLQSTIHLCRSDVSMRSSLAVSYTVEGALCTMDAPSDRSGPEVSGDGLTVALEQLEAVLQAPSASSIRYTSLLSGRSNGSSCMQSRMSPATQAGQSSGTLQICSDCMRSFGSGLAPSYHCGGVQSHGCTCTGLYMYRTTCTSRHQMQYNMYRAEY